MTQQEPLKRMLRATLTGLVITNFKLIDKTYCDDVQTLFSDVNEYRGLCLLIIELHLINIII